MEKHYDIVVVGSGIAGLFFARKAAGLLPGGRVAVITKKDETESNTNYAQGGIATVMSGVDSFDLHVSDTLKAGAGLCHRKVVEDIILHGPKVIEKLVEIGVKFTRSKGGTYDLGREGGHSINRVIHASDLTGREIERALLESCRQRSNIDFYRETIALDLITYQHNKMNCCGGVYTFTPRGRVFRSFYAPVIMLATGGIGQVYFHTTNPDIATGDGIAMAFRAGARVANMEFIQFHPTTLYDPGRRPFLISEAVRGEGGILIDSAGRPFMKEYHAQKDLAPRDIVARAIDSELKQSGAPSVFLDVSHLDKTFIKKRFPNIFKECKKRGIDITRQPIPVVPSAHYNCGGVVADLQGRTDISGLYVCGEAACTGMHGANRLASNSLLEAVVMADFASDDSLAFRQTNNFPDTPPAGEWLHSSLGGNREKIVVTHDIEVLKKTMSDFVGIVRSLDRLQMAGERLRIIQKAAEHYYLTQPVSYPIIELRNMSLVAGLIVRAATRRKESRGLHYLLDHPETDDRWLHNTVIRPHNYLPRKNNLLRRKDGHSL